MVSVAPIITHVTFVFIFHMRCISIIRSLYFRIFWASFFITFLSLGIATSIIIIIIIIIIICLFVCLFQVPLSATLKKTPFNCTCVREMWLMLQLYFDRIHEADHGKVSN
jgi:small-conductance mechanosensitive channel